MAGFPQPFFDWDDKVAIGYLRGCMRGRTLEWFDDEITTKANWKLTNLTDDTGQANLVAINGRTAIQIGADGLNEALGQPGTAIVKLRAVEGPWDEDWRVARGRPTNAVVNLPNAGNGTTVVVPGIRFGQAIWWLKTHFPTIEEELRDLQYGTIRKGSMTIDELYRKLLRIGRRANYRPEELRRKFIDALPLPWLEKTEDIARNKRDRIPDPLVSQQIYDSLPVSTQQQQGISLEDMQKVFQNAVVQQKTEFQSVLEKHDAEHKAEIESILQQKSKKIPPPIPPKNIDEIDNAILLKELYGMGYRDGPLVDFMETYKKHSDDIKRTHNDRIGRVEKGLNETRGSYTDVPVILKDKENKTVTVIGNFVRIDNGESKPILFLGMSNIRKVQGILNPNNNQFRINIHGKSYIIPTFSKAPVAKDPSKETEITETLDSDELETRDSNSSSSEELKKKLCKS
ncbi:12818_t:CDS:2 [Acaulospora morrowiae]|uniref:12818_t:CDS:1 n=1 Tax=Acaulospora morrowiae TaxID=94023 RepID=A0A9N9CW84_9GLOM|nr:12818_t:CDS:2 [Acaulospora morrowiae]